MKVTGAGILWWPQAQLVSHKAATKPKHVNCEYIKTLYEENQRDIDH